ncbi:MAG: phosphotransferase [Waterburya sp.]
MGIILSSENVVDFLREQNLCPSDVQTTEPIICKESKNFNLVVKLSNNQSFIVKQNRVDSQGKMSGSLVTEWLVQELINKFKDLTFLIQPLISEVLLFDWQNSAVVSVFYDQYIALDDFYESRNYDPRIAQVVGTNLAKIHSTTYQKQQQREFLAQYLRLEMATQPPSCIRRINTISPRIFAEICPDGLDFYRLYQRFPSLNQAVIELYEHLQPACLTHNDLTLDNFIVDTALNLDTDLEIRPEQVKIIDWEFINWGDPAVDLGMIVSQYLAEWLNSLVADRNLDLNTTLSLATCPLEKITPSLEAFLQAYLAQFPQILEDRPDFVSRVVQLAGIGILKRMEFYVGRHYHFHNDALCKLQVAKTLLCEPEQGITTLFGTLGSNLTQFASKAA